MTSLTSFENPLPNHPGTDNCIVFELWLPCQFALWRDATIAILSACSRGITELMDGQPLLLSSYLGYNKWFINPYPDCKLTLAVYKAKYDTSYHPPMSLQDAIKPHSMNKYQVLNRGAWASNPFSLYHRASIQHLPELLAMEIDSNRPYGHLQPAVSTMTYTPNQIIASQDICPESITLHDHEAFGHIHAGHKLQWQSMLHCHVFRVQCAKGAKGPYSSFACSHTVLGMLCYTWFFTHSHTALVQKSVWVNLPIY